MMSSSGSEPLACCIASVMSYSGSERLSFFCIHNRYVRSSFGSGPLLALLAFRLKTLYCRSVGVGRTRVSACLRGRLGSPGGAMEALAEERTRKRARIQTAVGVGQCSNSALFRILEEVRRHPELLDDVQRRSAIGRAMRCLMDQVGTTIDVPTLSGVFPWAIADLGKLLALLVERSPAFSDLMATSYAAHPLPRWLLGALSSPRTS